MLSSLQIENVAVIQKANVHFEKGLNVLTGETGAGKSILIDSINAILGNRTSKDLVRTGAAKAVIRAAFDDVPPAVLDSLEKAGYERSEALTLSREITAEGKSTCRINGMPATAAILRELCGGLININGQHDSVGLLNPARHEGRCIRSIMLFTGSLSRSKRSWMPSSPMRVKNSERSIC